MCGVNEWLISLSEYIGGMSDELDNLKAENAELRELVAVGLRCCDFKCDGCRFNKHNACYVGEFEDEARKLGVEPY